MSSRLRTHLPFLIGAGYTTELSCRHANATSLPVWRKVNQTKRSRGFTICRKRPLRFTSRQFYVKRKCTTARRRLSGQSRICVRTATATCSLTRQAYRPPQRFREWNITVRAGLLVQAGIMASRLYHRRRIIPALTDHREDEGGVDRPLNSSRLSKICNCTLALISSHSGHCYPMWHIRHNTSKHVF